MPGWSIHNRLGLLCNIPINVMQKVNELIDRDLYKNCVKLYGDENYCRLCCHDPNRQISSGHWDPEALLYLSMFIYEYFNDSLAIKVTIHHNLMDYTWTILSTGPYGYKFKELIRVREAIVGRENVCEEKSREVHNVTVFADEICGRFTRKVLEMMIEDLRPLENADPSKIARAFPRLPNQNVTTARNVIRMIIESARDLLNRICESVEMLAKFKCYEIIQRY